MVDGPTEAVNHELTEKNRTLVRSFVEIVLVGGQIDKSIEYIDEGSYIEHNPHFGGDASTLRQELESTENGLMRIDYSRIHRVLAEGNFVLSICEGNFYGTHSAFYDLFRVAKGKLVEHWDTTEKIAPRSEWKNNNGKF